MTNETPSIEAKKRMPRPVLSFKEWRLRKKMSQRDVAALLGVHQAGVCRLDNPEEGGGAPLLETAARVHVVSRGRVPWWSILPEDKRKAIFGERGRP